jgi:hypothetical protein
MKGLCGVHVIKGLQEVGESAVIRDRQDLFQAAAKHPEMRLGQESDCYNSLLIHDWAILERPLPQTHAVSQSTISYRDVSVRQRPQRFSAAA